ncbi:MAG: DUF2284 domain-containing protein [Clostridia bacterium]
MTIAEIMQQALALGFSHTAPLKVETLKLLPEVREMCASNKCGKYNHCWTCPPGCGTLTDCEQRIRNYHTGLIVQTVGELEDSMDIESMMAAEKRHKDNFIKLSDSLRTIYPSLLALGSGGCRICEVCAYPDAPCRFPGKAFSSMEANGLLVTDVCRENGLPYYYGPNTIAYTSCYLLK